MQASQAQCVFVRRPVAPTGVNSSLCTRCGQVIAWSSAPRLLKIAEQVHICKWVDMSYREADRSLRAA